MQMRWTKSVSVLLSAMGCLLVADVMQARTMRKLSKEEVKERHKKRMQDCKKACKGQKNVAACNTKCDQERKACDICLAKHMRTQLSSSWKKEFRQMKADREKFDRHAFYQEIPKEDKDASKRLDGGYLTCVEAAQARYGQ